MYLLHMVTLLEEQHMCLICGESRICQTGGEVGATPRAGAPVYYFDHFPENCMKIKKIGRPSLMYEHDITHSFPVFEGFFKI